MSAQLDATKWVNDYSDMLYRYALPRVNDSEIAKDLVQDTFLAAWRNYDNFKGEISEKNWLYAILKNKIIDHFRKASTRLTDSLPGMADDDPYFDEAAHWKQSMHPKEWDDSDSLVTKKEFYEVLSNCKNKLKQIQDTVFTMKYLEGLDSEEICKVLNLTSSNYWVLIHRAKLQLRACLEKNWFTK
ncbi:sigma-70 family RNA polymerase sigma factor [Panacibacter ginsenosidivorans]|uniref:Sigma-70 family RNA polymerase sigma factor n=1 Tax=Panacibacter ginsenosidivorans TaxID=1813871 RepID=A0A5B8V9P3_9BACT|nr:sigma-70 family RNA polymerase sigma factor [Panacibacter ginsenosidivorans]QEC68052.1 sigma-70 family RNA polymerase sigma factor [Panacibacter ginsenosidivorans]